MEHNESPDAGPAPESPRADLHAPEDALRDDRPALDPDSDFEDSDFEDADFEGAGVESGPPEFAGPDATTTEPTGAEPIGPTSAERMADESEPSEPTGDGTAVPVNCAREAATEPMAEPTEPTAWPPEDPSREAAEGGVTMAEGSPGLGPGEDTPGEDTPGEDTPGGDSLDEVHPVHGFAPGEEPADLPEPAPMAHPQHAPDFDQPVYSEQQLAPVGPVRSDPAASATHAEREPQIEQRLPMPARVLGGVVAGLIAAQGVARFGEMVLQAFGVLVGHVPPLIGVLGFVLFALPVTACALLASRGTRYSLIVGGVLAVVVAVLGRIGGVDLLAVLSG